MGSPVPTITAAIRALRARPTLTIAAILTLALSIGATTAIFTVVNGVVLRPLPFANESRLITICEVYPGSTPDWCSISPPNVEDIAARSRAIEEIGIGRHGDGTLLRRRARSTSPAVWHRRECFARSA